MAQATIGSSVFVSYFQGLDSADFNRVSQGMPAKMAMKSAKMGTRPMDDEFDPDDDDEMEALEREEELLQQALQISKLEYLNEKKGKKITKASGAPEVSK